MDTPCILKPWAASREWPRRSRGVAPRRVWGRPGSSFGGRVTKRLYYENPYGTEFAARVVEWAAWDGEPALVLDQTAFYPEGGGQPADRGVIEGVAVVNVQSRSSDGAVLHVVDRRAPELAVGCCVRGCVDSERRFDHMQQHSGQHVLSAAFLELLEADTVGFHLGEAASTVDIDLPGLDHAKVQQVEQLANRVVWQNRPIRSYFASRDDLPGLRLRRAPQVSGPVRIVEIGSCERDGERSFDANPCGGTHVPRTGEIGVIKVVRVEHRNTKTRVHYLCGGRALKDYVRKHQITAELSQDLTVGVVELHDAVGRLKEEGKELRRHLRQANATLLDATVEQLNGTAVDRGSLRAVCNIWGDGSPIDIGDIARGLSKHPRTIALLAASDGASTVLCFSRARDVDVDVSVVLRDVCARLGGKGGGQPHLARGSLPGTRSGELEPLLAELLDGLECVP